MQTVYDLETPSVLINLDKMEHNILTMQERCNRAGIGFRPHIKTHKIPDIARRQLEAGAVGIACQKVSEAQVFVDAGIDNIQIPYNILGEKKTARLADLSMTARVTVSADNPVVIAGLQDAAKASETTIRVMVDLATEIERTGAPANQLLSLAQQIDEAENLHFAGILVYPSNPSIRPALLEALDALDKVGIGVDSISGGGIQAAMTMEQVPELTEIRVGTYVFNDLNSIAKGCCTYDDCAMTILATVVSRASEDRGVLDCGSKTLAADKLDGIHGYIVEYPNAKIYQLSEEHGHVDFSECKKRPAIGEQVHVIPVHTCVVTNLHNQIYGVRGETIEHIWKVEARGLVW